MSSVFTYAGRVTITWRRFLLGLTFSPGWKSLPHFKKWARIFSPGWKAEKPHVIAVKFKPGLKREFEQAH